MVFMYYKLRALKAEYLAWTSSRRAHKLIRYYLPCLLNALKIYGVIEY
jgi:hypothetical protein